MLYLQSAMIHIYSIYNIYIYIHIYIYIYTLYIYSVCIYIYRHYLKTLSKNVSTTVFFNLISLTQCPSHSNKIKYFLYYNIKLQSNTFVTKEVIIFIVIVNVLFTLFHVKYVAYNMLGQQFTNSV